MSTAISTTDATAVLQRIRDDPMWFITDVLGQDPWEAARDIIAAIGKPHARVAVKACHASAKTHTSAAIVLWWVFSGGIAVTTAPSWPQVKKLLWGEIHDAYHRARVKLGGVLNQTELIIGPQCYATGLSTNEGVRFQGFHGRVLIVIDEAPGVLPEIWEAIEGIRAAGDVRVLALGNPTIASGPFYDAFGADRARWQTFTIDAFNTPNLRGVTLDALRTMPDEQLDDNVRWYLTSRRWVLEKLYEWGEDHPLWQARVRGQFPLQRDDALISMAWIEAARNRETVESAADAYSAGLDVAGPGEAETVLVVRKGPRIVSTQHWTKPDPRGEVVAALLPYKGQRIDVYVDTIGIGYYMARHIETELGKPGTFNVHNVNVGDDAIDKEKYVNWKAELYWGLRLRFEEGDISGVEDETTIGQLVGIRYTHDARGRIVIESKKDAAKRGVKSPDRGEAMMLCFARAHKPRGKPFASAAGGSRPQLVGYQPR